MHFMRVVFQFSEYGNVVEVRINAKSVPGKVPVSRSVIELTSFHHAFFVLLFPEIFTFNSTELWIRSIRQPDTSWRNLENAGKIFLSCLRDPLLCSHFDKQSLV